VGSFDLIVGMICPSSEVTAVPMCVVWVQPQFDSQSCHPVQEDSQLDNTCTSLSAAPIRGSACPQQRARRGVRGGRRLHAPVPVPAVGEASKDSAMVVDDSDAFCAKLLSQLEAGGDAQLAGLQALHGHILDLAFTKLGCRVVQVAIEVANQQEAAALCSELTGCVRKAVRCPHANYIIQKIVQVLPPSHVSFIVKELIGVGREMARHSYGCRVLCRLLEHHSCAEHIGGDAAPLIDEVVKDASELCRHSFGHHVIQSIVEHGTSQHRESIIAVLFQDMFQLAGHRSASYVVEKALVFGCFSAQQSLALDLIGNVDHFLALAENQFGCRVIAAVLRISGGVSQMAQVLLKSSEERLQLSKYGRRILEDVKRCSRSASF